MALDQALSWMIAAGNPTAGILTGPRTSKRYKTIGWLILGAAQLAFFLFGQVSPYPAFRILQPCMIPIAMFNYWLSQQPKPNEAI